MKRVSDQGPSPFPASALYGLLMTFVGWAGCSSNPQVHGVDGGLFADAGAGGRAGSGAAGQAGRSGGGAGGVDAGAGGAGGTSAAGGTQGHGGLPGSGGTPGEGGAPEDGGAGEDGGEQEAEAGAGPDGDGSVGSDASGDLPDADAAGDGATDAATTDAATTDAATTDAATDASDAASAILETVNLEPVWSRHPTSFALVTRQNQQFAAYYDANRQMKVAQRTLGEPLPDGGVWTTMKLNSYLVQCDSHNYVTMAIDRDGYIHVSGNMHGAPLVYYRSTRPLDVTSLASATPMVGSNEAQVTYPQFFFDTIGDLVFAYRDGSSGKGNYIFNKYDAGAKAWSRLLSSSLISGEGTYSAYPVGPIQGPDGWFHLVWVWRDTPDAETNHDLSYAKTQDLVNWQNAAGQPLTLPIVYSSPGIIVDPVPPRGGMINNNTKIGFDAQQRVVLSYHKNDTQGTQLFSARRENDGWDIRKTSSWTTTWYFEAGGTLVFEIIVEPVMLQANGDLIQKWYHARNGGWGAFRLDPNTLAAVEQVPPPLPYPSYLDTPTSTTAGMVVQWAQDSGSSPDPATKYMLRWETLPSNRDMCPSTTPPATPLKLYAIRQADTRDL